MVTTTIKDFHDFIKEKNIDLSKQEIMVTSKNQMVRIQDVAITKKNSFTRTVLLENNLTVTTSAEHRLYKMKSGWCPVDGIRVGESVYTEDYGFIQVLDTKITKKRIDLYDLQVETEQYYTNGILSHNSTISNAMEVGLFGKLSKKTLKEIPNRKNGNAEVKIDFKTSTNQEVSIHRKLSPDGLTVLVNGEEPQKTSSKKDVQNYIENELLDMSYYVFTNMVSISLNDFKSFLSMTPDDKRKIIDKVLSLSVYNQLREIVRKKIKDYDGEISSSQRTLDYIEGSIKSNQEELDDILEKLKNKKEEELDGLKNKLEILLDKEVKIQEKVNELKTQNKEFKKDLDKTNVDITDLKYQIKTNTLNLKLYESSKCPTCESDLKGQEHQGRKILLEEEIEKLEKRKDALMVEWDSLKENQEKIANRITEIENKNNELSKVKYQVTQKIKEVEGAPKEDATKSIEKIINENKEKLEELEKDLGKNQKNKKFYEIVETVVGDKGIKNLMIANIIPHINNNINDLLEKFDLTFNIELDSFFNVKLTQYNAEISTATLSMGESKILDFCVLVAMIKVLKTKYPNLNTFFLDEIFASLDNNNTNIVIGVLKDFTKETKMNIFLIHHAHLERSLFDNYISVVKTNGFADLEYVENF
jgi:DNA repair exonuclease SbcCD ATPase subunit